MSTTERERVTGLACPVDMSRWDACDFDAPYLRYISLRWERDDDGVFLRGERINGLVQCPKCGVWWPNVEEPDCWTEGDDGRFWATGWWGAAVCGECHLLLVEQPDGTPEAYQL